LAEDKTAFVPVPSRNYAPLKGELSHDDLKKLIALETPDPGSDYVFSIGNSFLKNVKER